MYHWDTEARVLTFFGSRRQRTTVVQDIEAPSDAAELAKNSWLSSTAFGCAGEVQPILSPIFNTVILYLLVVEGVTRTHIGVWHYIRRPRYRPQDWVGG
jgi:hypothetical protein